MAKLEAVVADPGACSVDMVLADIGFLASAFHGRLHTLSVGNGMAKGWNHEPWGSQMAELKGQVYVLMTDALMSVTAAALERLNGGTTDESLREELARGLQHLLQYKQSGMPVDEEMLAELLRRTNA